MPTRDIGTLTAGWQGDIKDERAAQDWWTRLDPGSPDAGPIMLQFRDRMQAGTATPQERALYGQVRGMAEDWDYRASAPRRVTRMPSVSAITYLTRSSWWAWAPQAAWRPLPWRRVGLA